MLVKFAGSHIHKGFLKAGIAVYPEEGDRSYAVQHIQRPVIPETGIPEGLEGDELEAWLESLPKIWVTNPSFTHFIKIDPNLTKTQLEVEIQRIFTPNVLRSGDLFLSTRGKDERADFSRFRKMMAEKHRLGNGLVLPNDADFNAILTQKHRDFKDIHGRLDSKGKILPYEGGTIDIGDAASDRGDVSYITGWGTVYTRVNEGNSANSAGSITSYEIWLNSKTGTADVWIGTFSASGNVLTVRDSESIGDIATGSKQTGSGQDIDVETGDYFGVADKSTSHECTIEYDASGYTGVWSYSGECIDASDSQTFTYLAGDAISLYGEGQASIFYQSTGQGAVTPTGALGLKTSITVGEGAITPTGALGTIYRFIQSVGSGAITPVGALGLKIKLAVGSGSITPTGALSTLRKIFQSVGGGAITPAGALGRLIKITVGSGAITPTGALSTIKKFFQTVGEGAITPVGALGRLIKITVGETLGTLHEYYDTGDDGYQSIYGTLWEGQSFTPSSSHTINKIELKLYRIGSPGTVTVSIRATDGSGHPTGSDLCSGTTDGDTLTTDTNGEWRGISLAAGTSLTASTKYAIVARTSGNISNQIRCRRDGSSPTYAGGCRENSADGGSNWSSTSGTDLMFRERMVGLIPIGALGRKISLAVGSGSITPVGALNLLIKITVGAGSITPTGALGAIKRFIQSVGGGSITPTGALNLLIKIGVGAGAITPVGALGRLIKIAVGSGSVTPSGALGLLTKIAVGAGSIIPTGALNRLIKITVGQGSITPVGVLATFWEWINLTLPVKSLALTLYHKTYALTLKVKSYSLTLLKKD